MSVDYPAETYNGHPARYLTDENGVVIGLVKPNTNGERAPVPVFKIDESYNVLGIYDDGLVPVDLPIHVCEILR